MPLLYLKGYFINRCTPIGVGEMGIALLRSLRTDGVMILTDILKKKRLFGRFSLILYVSSF